MPYNFEISTRCQVASGAQLRYSHSYLHSMYMSGIHYAHKDLLFCTVYNIIDNQQVYIQSVIPIAAA